MRHWDELSFPISWGPILAANSGGPFSDVLNKEYYSFSVSTIWLILMQPILVSVALKKG